MIQSTQKDHSLRKHSESTQGTVLLTARKKRRSNCLVRVARNDDFECPKTTRGGPQKWQCVVRCRSLTSGVLGGRWDSARFARAVTTYDVLPILEAIDPKRRIIFYSKMM